MMDSSVLMWKIWNVNLIKNLIVNNAKLFPFSFVCNSPCLCEMFQRPILRNCDAVGHKSVRRRRSGAAGGLAYGWLIEYRNSQWLKVP